MKKNLLFLIFTFGLMLCGVVTAHADELDRVIVYINNKLVGTWRANENQMVHINGINDGDTLTFKAATDLGGLANSSIDIKDNNGVPLANIESPVSSEEAATFVYVLKLKKIDTAKVTSLQVFLNVDPARNLPSSAGGAYITQQNYRMKKTGYIFLLLACLHISSYAQFACAGLERVDIYQNGKLSGTATVADAPTIQLNLAAGTDTIVFHAYTDFEGLRNSTLDVTDESGELMDHINSTNNTGYEAVFTYVFNLSTIDEPDFQSMDIVMNLLCERDITTEQIATLSMSSPAVSRRGKGKSGN